MLSSEKRTPTIKIVVPIAENEVLPPVVRDEIGRVLVAYPGSTFVLVRGGPGDNHLEATARNRNEGIERGGFAQYDYVLSQDSDVVVTLDALQQLLAFYNKTENAEAVVSAAYLHRGLKNRYSASTGETQDFVPTSWTSLHLVRTVGAGALLVPTSALTVIGSPWFDTPLVRGHQVAEDIGFSLKAASKNVPLYLNCDCVVDHVADAERKKNESPREATMERQLVQLAKRVQTLERDAMCNEAHEALTKIGAVLTVLRKGGACPTEAH